MATFPLALAIEPRLLPLAVANGFEMDAKVWHFGFSMCHESDLTTSPVSRFCFSEDVRAARSSERHSRGRDCSECLRA